MNAITLHAKTLELCHGFFRGFEQDAALFMDASLYESYVYDPRRVEAFFKAQSQKNDYKGFFVMLEGKPIGDVGFKRIDREKMECELEICMQSDEVKGRGLGTQAIRLALEYGFRELKMERIFADVVLKNERSRHIVEKLGFTLVGGGELHRRFVLASADYKKTSGSAVGQPQKGN